MKTNNVDDKFEMLVTILSLPDTSVLYFQHLSISHFGFSTGIVGPDSNQTIGPRFGLQAQILF